MEDILLGFTFLKKTGLVCILKLFHQCGCTCDSWIDDLHLGLRNTGTIGRFLKPIRQIIPRVNQKIVLEKRNHLSIAL